MERSAGNANEAQDSGKIVPHRSLSRSIIDCFETSARRRSKSISLALCALCQELKLKFTE
eukprot:6192401-Pleurochrysis_carterae.AAC.2